jgi:hypothetical protein
MIVVVPMVAAAAVVVAAAAVVVETNYVDFDYSGGGYSVRYSCPCSMVG